MKLFLLLIGFISSMLGVILAYRFDFTIGIILLFFGVFALWSMLPSTDENERLRRYDN
jgi:hypothetical protein|tara:strand:+ start:447 stop:620 length:174 start_codon:yes stop_codon:yes gene_type:complete